MNTITEIQSLVSHLSQTIDKLNGSDDPTQKVLHQQAIDLTLEIHSLIGYLSLQERYTLKTSLSKLMSKLNDNQTQIIGLQIKQQLINPVRQFIEVEEGISDLQTLRSFELRAYIYENLKDLGLNLPSNCLEIRWHDRILKLQCSDRHLAEQLLQQPVTWVQPQEWEMILERKIKEFHLTCDNEGCDLSRFLSDCYSPVRV